MDRAREQGPERACRPASGGPGWSAPIAARSGPGRAALGAPRTGGLSSVQAAPAANGIRASLIPGAAWHKSSFSGPNGNCVEAADLPAGVAVRNSRFPDGPALVFTEAEWDAFVRGVKGGDFG